MPLTPAQHDRALGVMLGTACGDALGAGYEFGPPLDASTEVRMKGGGTFNWAPGEWTDDTSMAIVLLEEFLTRDDTVLDRVTARWAEWASTAPDVGVQTRSILSSAPTTSARDVAAAAQRHLELTGRAGGNGSLMRTAPLALFFLDDASALAEMARTVSDLTHPDPEAGDACVIWSLAIRHAVLTGEIDLRAQLAAIPTERRAIWATRLDDAERLQPADFDQNGWVVQALQGAWSAIHHGSGLVDSLERAVRGGRDTDTVAAIAGGLAGARGGASAIPQAWVDIVHGWPGLRADDLARLTRATLHSAT